MSDQILASAIETLLGGSADTFVVCAGANTPVTTKTAAEVRSLLSVLTSSQIAAAYQPIGSYAASVHSHAISDVTGLQTALDGKQASGSYALQATQVIAGTGLSGGGTLAADRTLTVAFGSTSTTACVGNDARLSDARTPTAHTHGSITNVGAIGSTADLIVSTGASGVLETKTAAATRTILGVGTMATRSTYQIQVALSGNGQNISAGAKKGVCRVPIAGTITGFAVTCDPANEPSAGAVQVDLNTLNLTTGAATSVLSSVANIATGANVSTGGAISGTPSVGVGDQLSMDIDQGSDGRELLATITITAT
jgi:hypothetical protein